MNKQTLNNNQNYHMLMQSPFAFSIMKGNDLVVTLANDLMKEFWGKGNDVEGKMILEILPELINQPFPDLMRKVFSTGIPHYVNEILANLTYNGVLENRYFNIIYQPYYEVDETISGVTTIAYDVTSQVMDRRKIEESEGRFRLLVQQAPVAICVLRGADYIIETINEPMLEIWDRKIEDTLNKPTFDVLPEFKDQGLKELLDDVTSTGKRFIAQEHSLTINRNGTSDNIYVKFIYEPLRENGLITGVMALAHEITDLVNARKKIEDSEKYFRQLADLMPAKISNTSANGSVIYFNQNWLDYTGLSFDELKEFGYRKIMHPDEIEEFQKRFEQSTQKGTVLEMEMRFIDKNGDYRWHLNLASPVIDENKKIKMWVGITTEIDEQVKQKVILENEISNRTNDLERANKALIYQNEEKEKRSEELSIANSELMVQSEENEKRSAELVVVYDNLNIGKEELKQANSLLVEKDKTVQIINKELSDLNQELEQRVAKRTKALAESETRFRNMMETIPQIAWTNMNNGKITFYNQRWYDYTGLNLNQSQISEIKKIIHHDDLYAAFDQYKLIRQNIEGGEFQIRLKRNDGQYRWHLIRVLPIRDEEQNIELWVGTATDIQELRVLQQQKDDFISIASHELKTPITALKASLQLLERIKNNPSHKLIPELIIQANRSLNKVTALMENLLNTSRTNEGQLHLNFTLFKLSKLIMDCCQHVKQEGIYSIKTEGDLDLEVYADEIRIDQIVVNFVNNAIKYAPLSKEILVRIEKLKGMAKVSVIDKGDGIASEKLDHLFDRYYRVDSSGSQYSGLGLGLYISSEIIKKHNGKIGVESEVGKGTTFWFTLPIS